MHELTPHEVHHAFDYAKSLDEQAANEIIVRFELDQTALAQTIFGIFPDAIANENQEMSYLFMSICFDVLCVFQNAFGPCPSQSDMPDDWLEKQSVLLDAELKSLIKERHMDGKIKTKLQDRFVNRAIEDTPQPNLLELLNGTIAEYALANPERISAVNTTHNMIFIVVRLFSNLYRHATKK